VSGSTVSSAGAIGIAQFIPSTAASSAWNPTDPFASIDAAARYDRQLFDRFGSWDQVLAAYNWGPGNVENKGLSAAPSETSRMCRGSSEISVSLITRRKS